MSGPVGKIEQRQLSFFVQPQQGARHHNLHTTGQRREVLSEEEYSASLSKVIQRNYFPDLPELQAQVAIQEAREKDNDCLETVIATRRAARKRQEQERAARQQEETDELDRDEQGLRKKARPLDQETLDNFHVRVTSQDNALFETNQQLEIQQRQQERLRDTQKALDLLSSSSNSLGNNNNNTRKRQQSRRHPMAETPLMLASDQFNASPHRKVATRQETEQAAQTNNTLFFPPHHQQLLQQTNEPSNSLRLKASDRPLSQHGDDANDSNHQSTDLVLMPPPTIPNSSQRQQEQQRQLSDDTCTASKLIVAPPVEYTPKDSMEKRICPEATRFAVVRSLPHRSATARLGTLQDAVDSSSDKNKNEDDSASTTTWSTDSMSDLDAPPRHSLETQRRQARQRRAKENESLVDLTPLIVPGQAPMGDDNNLNDEPIMTWGQVSSTPLALSGQGKMDLLQQLQQSEPATGPTFQVAEPTTRETVADQALATLQARGRRAALASRRPVPHKRRGTTTTPLSSSSSLLLSARSTARASGAFGTALRASYARPPESNRRPSAGSLDISVQLQRPKSHLHLLQQKQHRTAHAATPQLFKK